MSCSVFSTSLLQDISSTAEPTNKIKDLKTFIKPYDEALSGIWQPLVIEGDKVEQNKYSELLAQPSSDDVSTFNPCDCNENQIAALGAGFFENYKETILKLERFKENKNIDMVSFGAGKRLIT